MHSSIGIRGNKSANLQDTGIQVYQRDIISLFARNSSYKISRYLYWDVINLDIKGAVRIRDRNVNRAFPSTCRPPRSRKERNPLRNLTRFRLPFLWPRRDLPLKGMCDFLYVSFLVNRIAKSQHNLTAYLGVAVVITWPHTWFIDKRIPGVIYSALWPQRSTDPVPVFIVRDL